MIIHKEYKSILTINKHPSMWFGVNYNINPYSGCQHRCIYCDSRASCYRVESFDKDVELLREVNKKYLNVSFTITTSNDDLSKKIEPYAPKSSERFKTMGILSVVGIKVGITLMPLMPYITGSEDDLKELIKMAKYYGAEYIVPSFGMSLKEGQREYLFERLGEIDQKLQAQYIKSYSKTRQASVKNYKKVKEVFLNECIKHGISTKAPLYQNKVMNEQISGFTELDM